MVDFTYSIVPATGKVTEGGSFTVTITPNTTLSSDVTVRWVIVPKGKLPISGSDFSTLTGTYDFSSGDDGDDGHTFTFTPSDDNILEPGKDFEIFFYQVVGADDHTSSETDDELIGSSQVHLADDETGSFGSVNIEGDGNKNILTAGFSSDVTLGGLGGTDSFIITRFQSGDVTISDTTSLIKFDYGVTITDVWERKAGPVREVRLTLETGAVVSVSSPVGGGIKFQLGDGSELSYAAFKTAIGATGNGNPPGKALTFNNDYSITKATTAPNVTGNPNDPADFSLETGGSEDVISLGSDYDLTVGGLGGTDVFVITRFQYGDATISDTTSLIKFDYGVTITDVWERKAGPVREVRLTLDTEAVVSVSSPAGVGVKFQLGDGEIMSYTAFKAAIGATGNGNPPGRALTFGDDYTIAFPSTNTAPTVTGTPSVDVTEDTAKTDFAAADFNFDDADTGDTLKAVKITVLPGAGTLELGSDADHDSSTTYTAVTVGQSIAAADIAKLRYTPAANATAATSFKFKVVDNHDAESAEATMAVSIDAVNDAPVFSSVTAAASVAESLVALGDTGLKFVATDVDDTLLASDFAVYERNSADTGWKTTASTLFEVVADSNTTNGWKIRLKSGQSLDYETASSIKLRVTATDDGAASANQDNFVLTVTDANDAPLVSGSISAALSGTIGQSFSEDLVKAGRFAASDADGDTLTYSIVKASDNSAVNWLSIDSGGVLSFATGNNAPSNSHIGSHSLKLKVTDNAGGIAYSAAFTLELGKTVSSIYATPFNGFDVGGYSTPSFVDIDGDGEKDLVSGNYDGEFKVWLKDTSSYTELMGSDNPFNGFDAGTFGTPSFVDIDGDGDMDLVSGEGNGKFKTWRKETDGSYTSLSGGNNPFNGFDVGGYSTPSFVDIDGDGDMDLVSGEGNGRFVVWRKETNGYTKFDTDDNTNPLYGLDAGGLSTPTFVDLDGDGDMDLVSGESAGQFKVWRNDSTGSGNSISYSYTVLTGSDNPFNGFDAGSYSAPSFMDLDGDGDMDLVSGESAGQFKVWFRLMDGSYSTTNDALVGTAYHDVITGTVAANTIVGAGGDDVLDGGAGNDVLFGGAGNDTLTGGFGSDTLKGGAGNDILSGGRGADTADFSDKTANITLNLVATNKYNADGTVNNATGPYMRAQIGSGGSVEYDYFKEIENITGGSGDDTLTGDSGANVLIGGAGQDTLTGGAGNDVFHVGDIATDRAQADSITDFAAGDTIDLGASVTKIWYSAFGGKTYLYAGNSDNSAVDWTKIYAVLDGTHTLDASDFAHISANANVIQATNAAPTSLALSGTKSVAENSQGATVGTLSATDSDTGQTLSFTLNGTSGDNQYFEISGTTLRLKSNVSFDYETKNQYTVSVKVSDGFGGSLVRDFVIDVTNVDESAKATNTNKGTTSHFSTKPNDIPDYVEGLMYGSRWGAAEWGKGFDFTYSFGTNGSWFTYNDTAANDLLQPTAILKNATLKALNMYKSVALLNFTEVTESATQNGNIRISTYSNATAGKTGSGNYAYVPNGAAAGGDVWLNGGLSDPLSGVVGNKFNSADHMKLGYYWLTTLIHEIGHAVGLSHPFSNYTNGHSIVWSAANGHGKAHTTLAYSVMSYAENIGDITPDGYNNSRHMPTTLMMDDIAAIQYLFGVNKQYNDGDTTYTLGSFSDRDYIYATIWDGGGNDTFSWADQTTNATINLGEGQFSFFGDISGLDDDDLETRDGLGAGDGLLGIARGAQIENATGGSGNDTIIGNALNNVLKGGAGNDVLDGRGGADTYVGGAGNDIYVLELGASLKARDVVTDFAAGERLQLQATPTQLTAINAGADDAAKLTLLQSQLNLRWTQNSHIATGNDSNDASIFDTAIYFTNGTPTTSDDTLVMVLEDFVTPLTYANFKLVLPDPSTTRTPGTDSAREINLPATPQSNSANALQVSNYNVFVDRLAYTNLEKIHIVESASSDDVLVQDGTGKTYAVFVGINTARNADTYDTYLLYGNDADNELNATSDGDGGGDENARHDDACACAACTNTGNNQRKRDKINEVPVEPDPGESDDDYYIRGYGGDDTITGGSGDDTLLGEEGNDTLYGGAGADILLGGAGQDTLSGGAGNDVFGVSDKATAPGINADRISDFTSGDKLYVGAGVTQIWFEKSAQQTVIYDSAARTNIYAILDGEVSLTSNDFEGSVSATELTPSRSAGAGSWLETTIPATAHTNSANATQVNSFSHLTHRFAYSAQEKIRIDEAADGHIYVKDSGGKTYMVLTGANANGAVSSYDLNLLFGSDSNNFIDVSGAAATARYYIRGYGGDDIILGGAGDDRIHGEDGNDTIAGGAGTDRLVGGAGNDILDGGSGIDWVYYTGKTVSVTLDLSDTSRSRYPRDPAVPIKTGGVQAWVDTDNDGVVDATDELDYIKNIEYVFGGAGDDSFTGDANTNSFGGGGGNDKLDGGAGSDWVTYSDKSVAVSLNFAATTKYKLVSGSWTVANDGTYIRAWIDTDDDGTLDTTDEFDYIKNIENIFGGAGDDVLTGGTGTNMLNGGKGNDTLKGGAGVDVLRGGFGADTADFSDKTQKIVASLSGSKYKIANGVPTVANDGTFFLAFVDANGNASFDASEEFDLLDGIEGLTGGSGNDALTGDSGANVLKGGGGNDTLVGGAGKDTLSGGAGNDVFNIADIATTAGAADIIKDFSTGTNQLTVDSATHIWWDVNGGNTRIMGGTSSAAASDKFYAILEGYAGGISASDFTNSGITVSRANTAPTLTKSGTGSIAENVATQTQTGISFSASDSETTPAASWFTVYEGGSGTTESTRFDVIDDNGTFKLVLLAGNALNYETTQSISLRVKISDGALDSNIVPVSIAVTDVNEFAPVISSSATTQGGGSVSFANDTFSVSYAEGAKSRYVLDMSATDTDGSQTPKFRLKSDATHGKANSLFTLSDDGILRFKADADYESLDASKQNAGNKASARSGNIGVGAASGTTWFQITAKQPGVDLNGYSVRLQVLGGKSHRNYNINLSVNNKNVTIVVGGRVSMYRVKNAWEANATLNGLFTFSYGPNGPTQMWRASNTTITTSGGTDSYYAVYAEAYDADSNARTDDVKIKVKVTDVANANLPPADDSLPVLPVDIPPLTGKTISGDSHVTESEATPQNDRIFGTSGDDILHGGAGDDVIIGGAGDDILYGGAGADILIGGAGNDILDGGAGADILTGGAGNDIFVLETTNPAMDVVTDFTSDDKIRIDLNTKPADLATLKTAANIDWTNNTNHPTGTQTNDAGINDTVIYALGANGALGGGDDVVLMVLEDVTTALTFSDFEIV